VKQQAIPGKSSGTGKITRVAQGLVERPDSRSVEGIALDGTAQVGHSFGESADPGQGTTQDCPRHRQIGPGQGRFVVVKEVPRQVGQQSVQPPAEQVSLGSHFNLGIAGIDPGGLFPLDADQIVPRRE
jgi:hypothetical protein